MSNKILVVDDDPAVRKMLTLLLESVAAIHLASTGEEALLIVAAQRPRLMMLDLVMPGMGGLETLKAARAAAPAMTVIRLTGKNDLELAKKALELGAVEYVTKPFDLSRLKDKVKRSLETLATDDMNNRGLPWHVVSPEKPSAPGPKQAAPADGGLSRWEGEGGGLAKTDVSKEPHMEIK